MITADKTTRSADFDLKQIERNPDLASEDPTPLSYDKLPDEGTEQLFSFDNQKHLLSCLSVDGKNVDDSSLASSFRSAASADQNDANLINDRRASVKFDLIQEPPTANNTRTHPIGLRDSLISITSFVSELSFFETQSLNSDTEVLERETEFDLHKDFEQAHCPFENSAEISDDRNKLRYHNARSNSETSLDVDDNLKPSRRNSILRNSRKWSQTATSSASKPLTTTSQKTPLSSIDATPANMNFGGDKSNFSEKRRKNVVPFGLKADQLRSSGRMSLCSVMTDSNGKLTWDIGSSNLHMSESFSMLADDDFADCAM